MTTHRQPISRFAYFVQPQSASERGFVDCSDRPHRAARWAVIRETRQRAANGSLLKQRKMLVSYPSRVEAEMICEQLRAPAHRPVSGRTLGQRFGAIGRVIASSLRAPAQGGDK